MITQFRKQVTTQQVILLVTVTGLSSLVTGSLLLGNSYQNKLFPNTYINSTNVSGLDKQTSITKLEEQKLETNHHELIMNIDDISIASNSAELGYKIDFTSAVDRIYNEQHKHNPLINSVLALFSYFKKSNYEATKEYDAKSLQNLLTIFNQKIELIGQNPKVELKISGSPNTLVVFPGKPGRKLDLTKTTNSILNELQNDQHQVTVQIASTSSVLNQSEIDETISLASGFVNKKLIVTIEDQKFSLDDKKLISLINPLKGYDRKQLIETVNEWADKVDRPAQNAIFDYNEKTLEVAEFVPNKDGLEIDIDSNVNSIIDWLTEIEQETKTMDNKREYNAKLDPTIKYLPLSVKRTKPEITLEQTNNLGINERIGFGESYYYHSIPNRVHNVTITNKKMNFTIVPPGKEFSFNKILGDVSQTTGYRPAYIISGGKTILGDGGGVCQVSSTTFRAVLDAGLDVTKRIQHAYRVSYYELNSDPGFDATVYSGDIDFRFINDTPNHIILLYKNDPSNLYMSVEIYGTDDGRISSISDYKKWDAVGAPAAEYFPTTDLPSGVKKQVDWAVSGIKTEFTYTVTDKSGNIIHNDTYYSNYRPWSAKYMVGI